MRFTTNLPAISISLARLQALLTHRTRSPLWLAAWLVMALTATWWWWPSADDSAESVLPPPVAPVPAPAVAPAPISTVPRAPLPVGAKPADAATSASPFKLVGTVKAANSADSFALIRTANAQLVRLRAGDRIDGMTVRAIESDSVVLAGVAHTVVVEADRTAPAPVAAAPSPALVRAPASQEEPAWAGDPAPFGH